MLGRRVCVRRVRRLSSVGVCAWTCMWMSRPLAARRLVSGLASWPAAVPPGCIRGCSEYYRMLALV